MVLEICGQDMGSKARDTNPRQDQEPGVIDHKAQPLEPQPVRPTEERFAVTTLQRGSSSTQKRDPTPIVFGHVA